MRSLSLRSFFLLCTVWVGAVAVAGQPVDVGLSSTGNLVLRRLPQVLDDPSIAPKLTSGLTTTFYFRVSSSRRDRALGGADLSLRYDLWEEVFLLTLRNGHGETRTVRQPADRLEGWWASLQIVLVPSGRLQQRPSGAPGGTVELELTLTVLPYSSGELEDTKRWLSRSGATGRRRPPDPGDAAQTSSHLFDLLLGTSLERKALYSKKWVVPRPATRPSGAP